MIVGEKRLLRCMWFRGKLVADVRTKTPLTLSLSLSSPSKREVMLEAKTSFRASQSLGVFFVPANLHSSLARSSLTHAIYTSLIYCTFAHVQQHAQCP